MVDDGLFQLIVVGWLAAAVLTVLRHRRQNGAGAGLVLCWLLSLALIHWLAAAAYTLPWYYPPSPEWTLQGFIQSAYAVAGFGLGVVFLAPALRFFDPKVNPSDSYAPFRQTPSESSIYLAVGAFSYFVLLRLIGGIPTVSAIVSTGLSVIVGGLCLTWSSGLKTHSTRWLIGWLLLTAALPIGTLVTQGFLGFGSFAVLAVACFVAARHGRRLHVVAVGFAVTYIALSIYVTYMRDRTDIRDSVWGGASYSDRFSQVAQSISSFELFDPTNIDHLGRIDARLNQNILVGAAVSYLDAGNRDYANGSTLWDAVVAVVPRALWPTKPVVAGSGSLVSDYTGFDFAYGTSVGVGPVFELFINFGTVGIVVGFIVVGAVVGALDRSAGRSLDNGNVKAFTSRYVPALAFLNVGGSLVELTAAVAAALVMVALLNQLIIPLMWSRQVSRKLLFMQLDAAFDATVLQDTRGHS